MLPLLESRGGSLQGFLQAEILSCLALNIGKVQKVPLLRSSKSSQLDLIRKHQHLETDEMVGLALCAIENDGRLLPCQCEQLLVGVGDRRSAAC